MDSFHLILFFFQSASLTSNIPLGSIKKFWEQLYQHHIFKTPTYDFENIHLDTENIILFENTHMNNQRIMFFLFRVYILWGWKKFLLFWVKRGGTKIGHNMEKRASNHIENVVKFFSHHSKFLPSPKLLFFPDLPLLILKCKESILRT